VLDLDHQRTGPPDLGDLLDDLDRWPTACSKTSAVLLDLGDLTPRADLAERVSGLDFVLFRDPVGTRPDCRDRRARPESRKSLI
jgi:hypothetical protein